MREFGNYDNLSQEKSQLIKEKVSYIKDKDVDVFYGFPTFDLFNQDMTIELMLVSNDGVYVFCENESDFEDIDMFIMQEVAKSRELYRLKKGGNFFKFKVFEDFDNTISDLNDSSSINKDVRDLSTTIFQKAFGINKIDTRDVKKEDSLGSKIKRVNNQIKTFDETQFDSLYKSNDKHLRIRGLAGSGKTILMVKKLAYLHFKFPSLKMAYVFYTVSLKQSVTKMFEQFFAEYSRNKRSPDYNNVKIMHSWGNYRHEGFYSNICYEVGESNTSYGQLKGISNPFEYLCRNMVKLLNENNIKLNLYDYLFVDEGQDFSNEFYKLARKSLKPSGKLIYAYDELQSLSNMSKVPSKKLIFGVDYRDVIDVNLSTCYRSPSEVIVTAHALGLGVYNKDDEGSPKISNFVVEDESVWNSVGYSTIPTEIKLGEPVIMTRNDIKLNQEDVISIKSFDDSETQNKYVYEEISRLILDEDVLPNDIVIIDMNSIRLEDNYYQFRNETYKYLSEKTYIKSTGERIFELNLVNKQNSYNFYKDNSVSYSTIYRAKGNEANIIFIVNMDNPNKKATYYRNMLFTAMTRAKYMVYISGVGDLNNLIEEYNMVQDKEFALEFTYPTKDQIRTNRRISKQESKEIEEVNILVQKSDEIKKKGDKEFLELLLEQTNTKDPEALKAYIDKLSKTEKNE